MDKYEFYKKFSEVTLKIGVNLQQGQGLEIVCPVEKYEVAEALTQTAYKLGAGTVRVRWENERIDKMFYMHAREDYLTEVPKWIISHRAYLVEKGFCYVAVSAEDPNCFKNVSATRIAKSAIAKSKALKKFSDTVMSNGIRWCVVSVPTFAWAKTVFPNSSDPETDLLNAISKTMRIEGENPVSDWENHIAKLEKHAETLNKYNFKYLHFKNSLGTDLKVGLAENHKWLSAKERAQDGVDFVANLPTEEVFTAPHKNRVDGVVKACLPLNYNGQLINNFSFTFKKGKITDFSAEEGYQTLKELLQTDNGTLRLGEVALIGKNSPIAKSGTLFYNTLFDENASCHLALGKAYPTTIQNGEKLGKKELTKLGVNDSVEHVDFMIGTSDLQITGVTEKGKEISVFENGEWVIA